MAAVADSLFSWYTVSAEASPDASPSGLREIRNRPRIDERPCAIEDAVQRTDTRFPRWHPQEIPRFPMKTKDSVCESTDETGNPAQPRDVSRRQLMRAGGAAAAAFSIVPRHVLGGVGFVPPSEKITMACIGLGTQAIREISGLLGSPDVQIVAVCDVEKDGANYLEWSKNEIRDRIRKLIETPTWREGSRHVPGGRDVGKEIVETYYAKQRSKDHYRGCAAYADFRELLENEKDVTAVKVMTPDHTHAAISIASLEEGNERDGTQTPGESPSGGQGGHRNGPLEEDRDSLPAGQCWRRSETGAGHDQQRRDRNAPRDPQLVDAARVAAVPDAAG